jgi:hypothetical protein
MFTRTRFQSGSRETEKRKRGPALWISDGENQMPAAKESSAS